MNTNGMPTSIIIFGASGDLTARKLVPALFNLYRKGRLPADANIVGFARRPYSHDEFRGLMLDGVKKFAGEAYNNQVWQEFVQRLWYSRGDLDTPGDYESLDRFLSDLEQGPANRLYYLATAPEYYPAVVSHLGAARMVHEDEGWRRIIIEKPFGHDLSSALALNKHVHSVFNEDQIYRIDHYLGKETAQNVLFFRFANTIFEPVWNRNYVDNIQITVAETVDVGRRAGFYDQTGILRDMFQNHLLQLLTLVTMEPPSSFKADAIRNEKVKVLSAIRPLGMEDLAKNTVRGQYLGYQDAPGVTPGSTTATYAALRLYVDNWRWQGVPFYLRSGKVLPKKTSQITIQFRNPPHVMFNMDPGDRLTPNILSIHIQPDEGIHLKFETKVPDAAYDTRSVDMEFHYKTSFGDGPLPEAYERLILDALNGDASLFTRSDEIETAWRLIDPILHGWDTSHGPPLGTYTPGSWGPNAADEFIASDGRAWVVTGGEHDMVLV